MRNVNKAIVFLLLFPVFSFAQNADTSWQTRLQQFNQRMQQLNKIISTPPISLKKADSVRLIETAEATAFVLANTDNPAGVNAFANFFM